MKYAIYVKGSAALMSVISLLLLLFSFIKLNRFSKGEVSGSIETDLPGVSIEGPGFFTTYADAQLLASVSFLLFIISTLLVIVFWNKTTTHFPKPRDHKTASASPADKSSNDDEDGGDNDDEDGDDDGDDNDDEDGGDNDDNNDQGR